MLLSGLRAKVASPQRWQRRHSKRLHPLRTSRRTEPKHGARGFQFVAKSVSRHKARPRQEHLRPGIFAHSRGYHTLWFENRRARWALGDGAAQVLGCVFRERISIITFFWRRDLDPDDIRDGRRGRITRIRVRHSKIQEEFSPHECAFLSPHHGYAESRV